MSPSAAVVSGRNAAPAAIGGLDQRGVEIQPRHGDSFGKRDPHAAAAAADIKLVERNSPKRLWQLLEPD